MGLVSITFFIRLKMTEKKVRDMIRLALKDQMKDIPTKSDLKKIEKDSITKKEVRDIIKKTMLSYHKWMWEKKGMWMSQI